MAEADAHYQQMVFETFVTERGTYYRGFHQPTCSFIKICQRSPKSFEWHVSSLHTPVFGVGRADSFDAARTETLRWLVWTLQAWLEDLKRLLEQAP